MSRRPAGEPGSEPGAPRPNASLARRLASLAYEALLLAAVILFVGFLTIPLATPEPGRPGVPVIPVAPARLLSACLVALGAGAYFCWSWTGGRRTLPMQTWGLRIERRDGAPVETKTAVARFLTAWIGPAAALLAWIALLPHGLRAHAAWLVALNYLWALVDPNRQFLHDRLAGTRITRVHRGPG